MLKSNSLLLKLSIIFFGSADYSAKVALILITVEKLLWMIFETFIDNLVKNLKYLVMIQIIVTSIGVLFTIAIIIDSIRNCVKNS